MRAVTKPAKERHKHKLGTTDACSEEGTKSHTDAIKGCKQLEGQTATQTAQSAKELGHSR